MMSKKITVRDKMPWETGPMNAPQGVRVENIPDGLVEVSSLYLWTRLSDRGARQQFRINGEELYRWTKRPQGILLMGKLSFTLVRREDRDMVLIEPGDHLDEFQFEVVVGLWSLSEALYYFFN